MEVLKFKLSGETAFFKKPDVNTYYYFTYGNIHKVALLGIFGAVLGLKGYNQQIKEKKVPQFPEFYERLQDLKIAIVPKNESGFIAKKVQTFNNSIGYASKEEGGNLIVKEQWLEKPQWEVYILLDGSNLCNELKDRLLNYRFEYIPYLGKNDHYANITDIKIFDNISKLEKSEIEEVNSLFLKNNFSIDSSQNDLDALLFGEEKWKYEERLPVALEAECNQYITGVCVFTNMSVICNDDKSVYRVNNKNLFFM